MRPRVLRLLLLPPRLLFMRPFVLVLLDAQSLEHRHKVLVCLRRLLFLQRIVDVVDSSDHVDVIPRTIERLRDKTEAKRKHGPSPGAASVLECDLRPHVVAWLSTGHSQSHCQRTLILNAVLAEGLIVVVQKLAAEEESLLIRWNPDTPVLDLGLDYFNSCRLFDL